MFVLMTYDVNAKRTGIFRKLLRKYLGHEQNSVFYGALKMSELTKLRKEINKSLVEGDKLTELIVPNRHNVEIAEYSKGNRVSGLPSRTSDEKHTRDAVVVEAIDFGRHCCGNPWDAKYGLGRRR